MLGTSFADLKEMGRWGSDSSLRVYLDVIAAYSSMNAPDLAYWEQHAAYFDNYFAQRWA